MQSNSCSFLFSLVSNCRTKKDDRKFKVRKDENPDPDQDCTFPFLFNGEHHCNCIAHGKSDDFWCATEVDSSKNSTIFPNKWGLCEDECLRIGIMYNREISMLSLQNIHLNYFTFEIDRTSN